MLKTISLKFVVPVMAITIAFAFLPDVMAQDISPSLELATETELYDARWSPDGQLLAVGGAWGVKIFDESLQELALLQGHTGNVVSVSWKPDSSELASAGGIDDGTIHIWERDLLTNKFNSQYTLTNNHNREFFVSWSPDSNWLASIGADDINSSFLGAQTEIWNTTTWTLERTLNMDYVTATKSLAWTSDSSIIMGAGKCIRNCNGFVGGIYLADIQTGEVTSYIDLEAREINALDIDVNGRLIVSYSTFIMMYDIQTLQRLYNYVFYIPIHRIAWSPNQNYIVFGYPEDGGGVIDTVSGLVLDLPPNYERTNSIDWNQDGYRFVTVAENGLIRIWDVRSLPAFVGTPVVTPFTP